MFLESLSAACGKVLGIIPWKMFFCVSCSLGKLEAVV